MIVWLLRKSASNLFRAGTCRRLLNTESVSSPPYRVLFCGTDTFAKTSLKALYDSKDLYSSIFVLTAPDAPNNWNSKKRSASSLVKEWAQEVGLECDTVPVKGLGEWQIPTAFKNNDPNNLLLTASFGHLCPPIMTRYFSEAQRLNLHPSLLPAFSGAAPIQWAIAKQQATTGVTIQALGDIFDSGSVYAQKEIIIPDKSTYTSLEPILAQEGSELLINVLKNLPEYAQQSWPQSKAPKHIIPSKAVKLKRVSSEIRWDTFTASDIEARHRGFGYLYPMTTKLKGSNRVILREMSLIKGEGTLDAQSSFLKSVRPGTAIYSSVTKSLLFRCRKTEHSILSVSKLQSEGKSEMEAEKWIIGYRDLQNQDGELRFE